MKRKRWSLWRIFSVVSASAYAISALIITYILARSVLLGINRPQIAKPASYTMVWWPFLLVALYLVLFWAGGLLAGLFTWRPKTVMLLGGTLCVAAGIGVSRLMPPAFLLVERSVAFHSMPVLKVLPWIGWTVGILAAGISLTLYLREAKTSGQLPDGG